MYALDFSLLLLILYAKNAFAVGSPPQIQLLNISVTFNSDFNGLNVSDKSIVQGKIHHANIAVKLLILGAYEKNESGTILVFTIVPLTFLP
jgi:hypothetical protein